MLTELEERMSMIQEFITAFILIFFAEMRDKSQLIAMSFATQYKLKTVLLGIFLGTLLNHLLALVIGVSISQVIPVSFIQLFASLLFIVFGFLSMLDVDDEETEAKKRSVHPIVTIAFVFFIGEIGDKTQLATIALTSQAISPLLTISGTVLGMLIASLIGIFIGIKLGDHIPEFYIKALSSSIFIVFGFIKFHTVMPPWILLQVYYLIMAITVITFLILIRKKHAEYRSVKITRFQEISQQLKDLKVDIKKTVNDTCLTKEHCGVCDDNLCIIGQIKNIIHQEKSIHIDDQLKNKFTDDNLLLILGKVILLLEKATDEETIHIYSAIRIKLEQVLFNHGFLYDDTASYIEKLKDYNETLYKKLKKYIQLERNAFH